MAKSRPVEATLSELAALKAAGPALLAEALPKYLASKTNLIVAKAADLAREACLASLQPHLADAFTRFMHRPAETDKGCAAKQAIASALYETGCDAEAVFLAGIRHVQPENAYGRPVDTAAELRGLCALGLVRMAYQDVMTELTDLLVDPSPQARIMAARALAYAGRDDGALLLRLKILNGDDDSDVTAECLVALGALARGKAIPFLRKYLDHQNPTLAEAAALALGEMRHAEALALLFEQWARDPFARQRLALPIALSRLPQSADFLIQAVREQKEEIATAGVEALRIYRHDDAVRAAVAAAVDARNIAALTDRFHKSFGG
jgi:hypothetical protein